MGKLAQTKLLLLFSLTEMPAESNPACQTASQKYRGEHIQIKGQETNQKSKSVNLKMFLVSAY